MANNSKSVAFRLKPIAILALLAHGSISLAFADVAPIKYNVSVTTAPNGAEIVNISNANSYGVSINNHQKFDVGANGVVLNNSSNSSNTVLAGQIQGNQNMARGPADIIVNQVWSANEASQLNGMIEVAGQKAHVVIANAAGITCNGCGFINASRATLTTTDSPAYYDPQYRHTINGGEIIIKGDGLKAADADFTDIIAHSVKVDAAIHAKDLRITTGKNIVSRDNNFIDRDHEVYTPNVDEHKTGIDVSRLGGMYADKITLIGSGKGVGVRNAGTIFSEGDIQITNSGSVINRGLLKSQGEIYYQMVESELDNRKGLIEAAGEISGGSKSLHNTEGKIVANGIQLGTAQGSLNNRRGEIRSYSMITINSKSLDNKGGKISSEKDNYLYVDSLDNRNGMVVSRSGTTNIFATTIKSSQSGGIAGTELNIYGEEIYDQVGPSTSPTPSNDDLINEAIASAVVKENEYAGTKVDWDAVNEALATAVVVKDKRTRSAIDRDAVNDAIASVKDSEEGTFLPIGTNKPAPDVDYETIEGFAQGSLNNANFLPIGNMLTPLDDSEPDVGPTKTPSPETVAFKSFGHDKY